MSLKPVKDSRLTARNTNCKSGRSIALKYLRWTEKIRKRVTILLGDVSLPRLGLSSSKWTELCHRVSTVFHNAAWVHGILPFRTLKKSNITSTLEVSRSFIRSRIS